MKAKDLLNKLHNVPLNKYIIFRNLILYKLLENRKIYKTCSTKVVTIKRYRPMVELSDLVILETELYFMNGANSTMNSFNRIHENKLYLDTVVIEEENLKITVKDIVDSMKLDDFYEGISLNINEELSDHILSTYKPFAYSFKN